MKQLCSVAEGGGETKVAGDGSEIEDERDIERLERVASQPLLYDVCMSRPSEHFAVVHLVLPFLSTTVPFTAHQLNTPDVVILQGPFTSERSPYILEQQSHHYRCVPLRTFPLDFLAVGT